MNDRQIKGVIFDLDGVMLDSEVISMRVWQNMMKSHSIVLPNEDYARTIGMASVPAAELLADITGIHLPVSQLLDIHWRELIKTIQKEAEPEPSLIELLQALLLHNLPLAVASNSPSHYVDSVLNALGVRQHFQAVICADQIKNAKPNPEIYLSAASALSISPQDCLAIEDSPIGLQAALAAGMLCVVIPNPHIDFADFNGAYAQYTSLAALFDDISTLLN